LIPRSHKVRRAFFCFEALRRLPALLAFLGFLAVCAFFDAFSGFFFVMSLLLT
jgi:hypothetical protein